LKDHLETRNNGKIKNIIISEINQLRIKLDQLEKMLKSTSQDFKKIKQDYDSLKVDLEKETKINKGKIKRLTIEINKELLAATDKLKLTQEKLDNKSCRICNKNYSQQINSKVPESSNISYNNKEVEIVRSYKE